MMRRPHLSRALLDDYFRGQASPEELAAEVVRVLERECEECRSGLAGAAADYGRAVREATLRARAEAGELEAARRRLPEVLQELAGGWPEALVQAAVEERFLTVAFVEYQIDATWAAVEGEAWEAAQQAAELATATAARLPVERYGRIVVTRLQAEADLARARVAVALGRDREARRALDAAETSAATTLSTEVEAGLLVGRAALALREGARRRARRCLVQGQELAREGRAGRWKESVRRMLEVLESREGRRRVGPEGTTPSDGAEQVEPLWAKLRERVDLGQGLKAMAAAAELAREVLAGAETDGSAEVLSEALEELAARCDLPGEALEALAAFNVALARDTLSTDDLDELEDRLAEIDPPWGPVRDER